MTKMTSKVLCLVLVFALGFQANAMDEAKCGTTQVTSGDSYLITNKDENGEFQKNCVYTFKKRQSVTENMVLTCSQFELDPKGCRKSFMVVNGRGFNRERLCKTQSNIRLETSGKKWKVIFKSRRNAAEGKVSCVLSTVAEDTPTTTEAAVTTPLPGCECGRPKRQTRIVGGQATEVNEYPWQVMLNSTRNNRFFCGGSLISEDWVLTAAHCLVGVVIHPDYDQSTDDYDFALVKLQNKVVFDGNTVVRPICLPMADLTESEGSSVTVSGWGTTSSGGQVSNVLQDGDSGGPVMFKQQNTFFDLMGVVSWGIGCATEGYPGVNADVFMVKDWILANAQSPTCGRPGR
eukprot:maker-scaffold359_size197282-snap-gene-0.24 protein:Tk01278 transcript:maker-scaffold359_size197282-snap-gene-0.24-mRNA-1 annotation:"af357226_1cub-serine protease"